MKHINKFFISSVYKNMLFKSINSRYYKSYGIGFLALLVTIVTFLGSVIVSGINHGSENLVAQMGADIIVAPKGTENDYEGMLLTARKSQFYMGREKLKQIKKIEGVKSATEQTFLITLEASCCDQSVQVVGINPKTDFTVSPWIKNRSIINSKNQISLKNHSILVGSKIALKKNRFKMFGKEYNVQSKLDESGTSMDNTIYINQKDIPQLLDTAKKARQGILKPVNRNSISVVLIKADNQKNIQEIQSKLSLLKGVVPIKSKTISAQLTDKVNDSYRFFVILMLVVWIVFILFFLIVLYITINERKTEFINLRVLGMSRKNLINFILKENYLIISGATIIGEFLVILSYVLFNKAIYMSINMPFMVCNAKELILHGLVSAVILIGFSLLCVRVLLNGVCKENIYE